MVRDIFTNKWILGGVLLLIVIAGACYFWYQHQLAIIAQWDRELVEEAERYHQSQRERSKRSTAAKSATDAPAESITPTAENPITETATDKTEPTQAQSEVPAENAETQEVRMSPFGFGPYPELPADFPHQDIFDPRPNSPYKDDPDYELMRRVHVELWKRGEKVEGMGKLNSTGLFYPTIRGTIYVRWAPRWKVFGKGFGRTIRYVEGHPDDMARLRTVNRESEIPSDLKVLDISEGIDAYEFLGLSK